MPNINQNPLPAHAEKYMIEIVRKDGEPKNSSMSIMMIRASESNSVKAPDSTKATPLTVEGVTEKLSMLNVKPLVLVVKGPPDDVGASQEKPKVVMPGIPNKPLVVIEGARCPVELQTVIVTYKGKEVEEEVNETGGLTRSGRGFTPEELRKAKPFKDSQIPVKKTVTEEEAGEFLKKMKVQDYSIMEQLKKIPARISLLSLLIHSDEHRRALMKILNEAYVPDKITVNHLEKIASKIFEANRITFSNDELPMEGTEHNRAHYLTVKCEDSVVSKVLVDNGSSENICPLSTLQKLKIGTERIHMNSVCFRGFDGGGKGSVGDIMLKLSIGPVEFTMEFQVLDVAVSYNLLLGRLWIHAAKEVSSSLHQMIKFEWDRQEIVMHGDEYLSAYNDTTVPFIEAEDDKGPWVYQTFETMSVEKIPEGECTPSSKLPSTSVMVANEMLKNGFVPGKGLGSSLQGIVHLVCPRESFDAFGATKHPISSVQKPVVDFDEELIKRFQSLFDKVNMVEIGEGSSNADAQLVGPNVKLSNWKATPLPTRKEFCSFYDGINDMACMRNLQPSLKSQSNSEIIIQEVEYDDETEYDEEAAFEEISKELRHFEEKPKPNLNEIEAINLGDQDNVKETKKSVHLEPQVKEEIINALFEYKDIFAWSYDDMPGLSTDLVVHKLPIDPAFPPVKQRLRKFKTDMSVKIKENITKQLGARVIQVTQYPTWLANVVSISKKDGKTRVCVDYRDLNKASPKDNFPLPNIHILIDNCAKHEIGSFVDCCAGYHQILMDEEDAEKTAFITPWGTYCYRIIPFGLKNAGATYMMAMTTIFHDMIHKEIEVYVDDVIIKSKKQSDHVKDLRMFFQRLRRYNLKLNLAKCAFVVPSRKLLGIIVNRCGIELDLSKIKAIQELPPPKNKTELLKKNVAVKWTDECQETFDRIKRYLLNPPVLVPPEPMRPLILYLTVLDNSFDYVLGQHNITGKKEQVIYYLSKNFTPYEVKYTLLERTCCALIWVAQQLKHYLSSYTTYLISCMDPLKYIFQKPMPI
ncbi:uncharacterized protein [Nicotiana tomentosiformis]|uniref:uncharacterized protein n=1 Tax=Nicotiana tomentosiformis TaxID=4098 RepID=UPI00388C438E